MNKTNAFRIIANIVYYFGASIALILLCIGIFGPNTPINPEAMLPVTWREAAFCWLAFGSFPMLLASMAFYKFNIIKNSAHKKRDAAFVFLPCLVCFICAAVCMGMIAIIIINALRHL